jgi:antitoxin (DNA-binding transcriptional repressor) of toxin-antitoxin stability system
MKTTNVAEFKKHLSSFLNLVEKGEIIEVRRRNVPIAQVVGLPTKRTNHTILGCGKDSVAFHGEVAEPLIPSEQWEMLTEQSPRR